MPKMTGGVKTGRFYIRLPEETIAEIDGYIKELGMYPAYFLSNAAHSGGACDGSSVEPRAILHARDGRGYSHQDQPAQYPAQG